MSTRAVWKFPVKLAERFSVSMPTGGRILAVQSQKGQPQIWASVDPSAAIERRHFAVVGTGAKFDASSLTHVGTFQLHDGELVFHLFEIDGAKESQS